MYYGLPASPFLFAGRCIPGVLRCARVPDEPPASGCTRKIFRLKEIPGVTPELRALRPKTIARIVIVDDNRDMAIRLFRPPLEEFGLEVVWIRPSDSLDETLRAVNREHPDLILMDSDLTLAGCAFDGGMVTQELRNEDNYGYAGWIVANTSEEADRINLVKNGADFSLAAKTARDFLSLLEPIS